MQQDDLCYHAERARQELHVGLMSQHIPTARAHLALASLHVQRVRELTVPPAPCEPLLRNSAI